MGYGGLEPPCGMLDLQSSAVAAVPISQCRDPGRLRSDDPIIKSDVLYPAELRGHY